MPERNRLPRSEIIREKMERVKRSYEDEREARAIVRAFNIQMSTKSHAWFWPKISAAITGRHPWLIIACDSCATIIDLDLRMKRRDPEASIRVALKDLRCPRCNGHGRTRITALARGPSV